MAKKVSKVPVILQMETLECGAASLAMIMAYYGKWVPLEKVREACGVSRDGSNAGNMAKAAMAYGMDVKAFRCEPSVLQKESLFPSIIHWEFNHFVVLNGFHKGKAIINDPAKGVTEVPMEEFDRAFTGVCLQITPGENFKADGHKKSMKEFLLERMAGTKSAFWFMAVMTCLLALFSLIQMAFSRVFVEQMLTRQNPSWEMPFFVLLSVLVFLQVITKIVYAVYSVKIKGKLAIRANADFMWHVLRLPVRFFSQRMTGDILGRKKANEGITAALIDTLSPIVLHVVMMVLYIAVLVRYSVTLAAIGVSGMILEFLITQYCAKKKANILRVKMRDMAKLDSLTINGIEMIETLKAGGAENGFFEKWSGCQAMVQEQNMKTLHMNRYYGFIPKVISILVQVLIFTLGLHYIMQGAFTVGMLLVFQSVYEALCEPVAQLSTAGDTIREMITNMERTDDVMKYETDVAETSTDEVNVDKTDVDEMDIKEKNTADRKKEEICYSKLSGELELSHVTFGYSHLSEPILKDFSLKVKPGQRVAIVGSSGCGKSTVTNLVMGLYKPWSGEILLDGKPVDEIDRNVFTGSVAATTQDITLFEDTIANNIKMWDESIEDYEMILAARDAGFHENVMQRPGGYEYRISEEGKNLSGGERQKLEIARAFAQDPTILLLDEATSALDAKTESVVADSMKKRGITCLIMAHRLSTIRDCDEIIVLDKGVIAERGTHEELMKKHGKYEELIINE